MGARYKPRGLPTVHGKQGFLGESKRAGTLSAGRRSVRVTCGEMFVGFDGEKPSRRLREARLPFSKRLEELLDAAVSTRRRELERETERASSA